MTPYAIERHLGTNAVVVPRFAPGESVDAKDDDRAPEVDILVRTSDVRRLSDFLMWQVRNLPVLFRPTSFADPESDNRPPADIVPYSASFHQDPLAGIRYEGHGQNHVGLPTEGVYEWFACATGYSIDGGDKVPSASVGGHQFHSAWAL